MNLKSNNKNPISSAFIWFKNSSGYDLFDLANNENIRKEFRDKNDSILNEDVKMNYKVISLENTFNQESNFDYKYHEKYINKIGEEIDHKLKIGVFKNFKLLVFEKDVQGKVKDADWIHKDDLNKI